MNPQHKPTQRHGKKKTALRILPLGGQEEVGRNMTVFEYGNDIVLLDMGMQFPEEDMPGIDYVIPDISYLRGKEKNIRAVIFSHGHLDHIGAAPILLEKLGNPMIIGRPLTLALIKRRQEDYKKGTTKQLRTLQLNDVHQTVRLGTFTASFFAVDHSIMDAVGVVLRTPEGTIIHPGDWTLEKNPIGRKALNYAFLAKLPKPTILMLECLGVLKTGASVPAKVMLDNLHTLIKEAPGRIVIGTFSSQIERIKYVIEYAEELGKKVAIDGYSMKMNVRIAKELGYIKAKEHTLIGVEQVDSYPANRVIVLCTGAQGEGNAVLSRIVNGSHRFIRVTPKDTIVFSSSIIPGNERSIQRLKDNMYRLTDNIIHADIMDVHSGGHNHRDSIVTMLHEVRPTYFLPVYANHFFLKETKKLAEGEGFPSERIFVLDNGSVFTVERNKARVLPKKVPIDYIFVDGLGIGDISHVVLRDRQQMAEDGMLVIVVTIDRKDGKLTGAPFIFSRGFVHMKESGRLIGQTKEKVKSLVTAHKTKVRADDAEIRNKIRDQIGSYLFQKTERRPMILPVIIEV